MGPSTGEMERERERERELYQAPGFRQCRRVRTKAAAAQQSWLVAIVVQERGVHFDHVYFTCMMSEGVLLIRVYSSSKRPG
jgi:hypothetical protein